MLWTNGFYVYAIFLSSHYICLLRSSYFVLPNVCWMKKGQIVFLVCENLDEKKLHPRSYTLGTSLEKHYPQVDNIDDEIMDFKPMSNDMRLLGGEVRIFSCRKCLNIYGQRADSFRLQFQR